MNDTNSIIQQLNYYLNDDTYDYAVLLNGAWGSGKTHFIKHKLKDHFKNIDFIYISLFNISRTDDLNKEIMYSLIADITDGKVNNELSKLFDSTFNKLVDKRVDRYVDSSGLFDYVAQKYLSKTTFHNFVLVFDDLDKSNLSISDILGKINYYVEHLGIKTIVVTNDDLIKDEKYAEYNEKLFGLKIEYKVEYLNVLRGIIDSTLKFDKYALFKSEDNLLFYKKIADTLAHYNLRTFQFFLSKAKVIFDNIYDLTDKEIINMIIRYTYISSIIYKTDLSFNDWKDHEFAYYYLNDEAYPAFKFVDLFVKESQLTDLKEIIDKYADYYKKYKNESYIDELSKWKELDDDELNMLLDNSLYYLNKNELNPDSYPKLLGTLTDLYVNNLLDKEIIKNVINKILIDVVYTDKVYIDWDAIKLNGETKETYDRYISLIKEQIKENKDNKTKNTFKQIMESDDLGVMFNDYVNKHPDLDDLLKYIDRSDLKNLILNADTKNLALFRKTIIEFYKDKKEIESSNFNDLLEILNETNKLDLPKTREWNISYFICEINKLKENNKS